MNAFVEFQASKFCEGSVCTHAGPNYAGIIVSRYHHLFHLRSLVSEFLRPR